MITAANNKSRGLISAARHDQQFCIKIIFIKIISHGIDKFVGMCYNILQKPLHDARLNIQPLPNTILKEETHMKFSPEQLVKAKTAKSAEELLALAKENGIEMTEEEANKYYADFHKEGALADEELDNVSGGCGGIDYSYVTKMKCANCGYDTDWAGDFSDGRYKCPSCQMNTMIGIEVWHK